MHVVLPWSWPSHGSYLFQGPPAVAWILHELGLPPTGTIIYGLEATFLFSLLLFWTVKARSLLAMSELGNALTWRYPCLAMPILGDASLGRRLSWVTPLLVDATLGRWLERSTCWLSSMGPRRGSTMCWLWPLVNARGRDGTLYKRGVLGFPLYHLPKHYSILFTNLYKINYKERY